MIVTGKTSVVCEDGTVLEATFVGYCPPPRSDWATEFAAKIGNDPRKMRAHYAAAVRAMGGGR